MGKSNLCVGLTVCFAYAYQGRMIIDVKRERGRLNLSRVDLAKKLGVGYQAVCKMERQEWNPTVATLAKVAAAIGMRVAVIPIAVDTSGGANVTGLGNNVEFVLCDNQGNHGEWCSGKAGHVGGCSWSGA